jgi:hypothetical protein
MRELTRCCCAFRSRPASIRFYHRRRPSHPERPYFPFVFPSHPFTHPPSLLLNLLPITFLLHSASPAFPLFPPTIPPLSLAFVTSGIPILYYGQEQGFTGGADPLNREPMWNSGYDNTSVGYEYVKQLLQVRDAAGAASSDFYKTKVRWAFLHLHPPFPFSVSSLVACALQD